MSTGKFLEILSQSILVGTIFVGRVGVEWSVVGPRVKHVQEQEGEDAFDASRLRFELSFSYVFIPTLLFYVSFLRYSPTLSFPSIYVSPTVSFRPVLRHRRTLAPPFPGLLRFEDCFCPDFIASLGIQEDQNTRRDCYSPFSDIPLLGTLHMYIYIYIYVYTYICKHISTCMNIYIYI